MSGRDLVRPFVSLPLRVKNFASHSCSFVVPSLSRDADVAPHLFSSLTIRSGSKTKKRPTRTTGISPGTGRRKKTRTSQPKRNASGVSSLAAAPVPLRRLLPTMRTVAQTEPHRLFVPRSSPRTSHNAIRSFACITTSFAQCYSYPRMHMLQYQSSSSLA